MNVRLVATAGQAVNLKGYLDRFGFKVACDGTVDLPASPTSVVRHRLLVRWRHARELIIFVGTGKEKASDSVLFLTGIRDNVDRRVGTKVGAPMERCDEGTPDSKAYSYCIVRRAGAQFGKNWCVATM